MWVKKPMPTLPGYETLGDEVAAKRWVDFKLSKLLQADDELREYVTSKIPGWGYNLKSREDICNFIISAFDYPMVRGSPTDCHRNNWFSGLCCHQVTMDYWQTGVETLRTLRLNQRQGKKGYGDCEDVAALFAALFLMKGWPVWDCLGYVYEDAEMLGGHSFGLFQDENGIWRLYEGTLSTPPAYPRGYLIADPNVNYWHTKRLTYHTFARFSRVEYYEWERQDLAAPLDGYLTLGLRGKETRRKHEAISAAWGIETKPLVKPSLFTKIRWR